MIATTMRLLSMNTFDKMRLLDNYVCDLSTPSVYLSMNYFGGSDWSLGFWIKVPMAAGIDAELLALESTYTPLKLIFTIKTVDAVNYSLCYNIVNCLLFTGGSPLLDSKYSYLRKIANNNWHYITICSKFTTNSIVIVSADNQLGFLVNTLTRYYASEMHVRIGSDVTIGGTLCKLIMQIHRVDLFPIAYSAQDGALLDQTQLYSFPGGGFTALYAMKQSNLAYFLFNILDFSTKRATIISDRTTKTAPSSPLAGDQRQYFRFSKQKFTINFPGDVIPNSPVDNSYSVVVTFEMRSTNIYSFLCSPVNSCQTEVMNFKIYIRSPKSDISFAKLGAQNDSVMLTSNQKLYHFVDNNPYLELVSNLSRNPGVYSELQAPFYVVTVSVRNNILMTIPESRMCYATTTALTCSTWRLVNSPLLVDDLHFTLVQQNTENYLFYILFKEISFLDTTEFDFYNLSFITNGNNLNMQIISAIDWEVSRVMNDSYLDITTKNMMLTTQFHYCFYYPCVYCELGLCYDCELNYEMVGSQCVYCQTGYVYDIISKKCYPMIDWANDVTTLIPTISSLSASKIVILYYSFSFAQDYPLTSNWETVNGYFNSIEATNFNPLTRTYYLTSEKSSQLAHLNDWLTKIQSEVSYFPLANGLYFMYATLDPTTYQIPNPNLISGSNNCNSPHLKYEPINGHVGRCVKICPNGSFYDVSSQTCRACPNNCAECVSTQICTLCHDSDILNEGVCSPPQNPVVQSLIDDSIVMYTVPSRAPNIPVYSSNTDLLKNITRESRSQFSLVVIYEPIFNYGFFLDKGQSKACPSGCIICTERAKCQTCDANFQKTSTEKCEAKHYIVNELSLSQIQDVTDKTLKENLECQSCTGLEVDNRVCEVCLSECSCSSSTAHNLKGAFFYCDAVHFDKEFMLKGYTHSNYFVTKVINETTLVVSPKRAIQKFQFKIDTMMVKRTINCWLKTSKLYEIDVSKLYRSSSLPPLNSGTVIFVSTIKDYIYPAAGFFFLQASSLVIYFIQFNKVFYFLSVSEMRVGGVYDYVNYNLHQNKNIEIPYILTNEDRFIYEQDYARLKGEKLMFDKDIVGYLKILMIAAGLWIISLVISLLSESPWRLKVIAFFRRMAIKGFKSGTMSINLMWIASTPLNLAVLRMTENENFKIAGVIFFLLIFGLQCYIYYKALDILFFNKSVENSMFHYLKFEGAYETNQKIIQMWLIDQVSVYLTVMAMYFLRRYIDLMLGSSLLLILATIIITVAKRKLVAKVVIIFKIFSQIGLFVFVGLLAFQHYFSEVPVLAFDIVYITSNFSKLCEVASLVLWVFFANRRAAKEVNLVISPSIKIIT